MMGFSPHSQHVFCEKTLEALYLGRDAGDIEVNDILYRKLAFGSIECGLVSQDFVEDLGSPMC